MSLFSKAPQDLSRPNRYGAPKLPPGQIYTDKFPVLTYGPVPIIETEHWKLEITGLVKTPRSWTWAEFLALPQTTLNADFHCVTHWSRFDDDWTGVLFRDFWEIIKNDVDPRAKYVLQHAYGGYTTNLPLEWMLEEDVLLAHTFNGQPLEPEHGGPMRVFTPKRYAWKGAKWLKSLEFLERDRPGFWEENGYSNTADPWKEERYWE
jgi:DMSO/TMAO reductase YedYZ molybdopterin-dependent catalytic subunit